MAGDSDSPADVGGKLKALTLKRGQVKGKITRLKTFIESFEPGDSSRIQLKIRLAKLDSLYEEFEQVQSEVEALDCSDSQQERESFEEAYYELAARGEIIMNSQSPVTGHHSNANGSVTTNQTQVKLPSIDLLTFSGHYEDSLAFSDSFKALIHTNEALSDVQRLHYLRFALKGESTQVIQALELTSTNYNVAWNLLEDRYQNKKIIVNKHVQALFDLPCVDKDTGFSIRRLLDSVLKHIRALKALDEPTDQWSTLLVHLVTSRLSTGLRRDWELSSPPNEIAAFDQLIEFLQRRCQALETASLQAPAAHRQLQPDKTRNYQDKTTRKAFLSADGAMCRLCNGNHLVYQCQELQNMPHEDRYERLKRTGICLNCLRPGHRAKECRSKGCKICSRKHNTIIHQHDIPTLMNPGHKPSGQVDATKLTKGKQPQEAVVGHVASNNGLKRTQILLLTALVDVRGPSGRVTRCRALLDCGSQSNFITENVAQKLGLTRSRLHCNVSGLSESNIKVNGVTEATIKSVVSSYKTVLNLLIVPKITNSMPSEKINADSLGFPRHIALADPTFGNPGRIDLLIGQEIFLELLCIGQIKTPGQPVLQETRLGWVVGGKLEGRAKGHPIIDPDCLLTSTKEINTTMERFWALEEPKYSKPTMTAIELKCEEHYNKHTTRGENGRYTVKLPLCSDPSQLGDSRKIATQWFYNLEKKLARLPEMRRMYIDFMREYENLGHMERVHETPNPTNHPECFLPHHPVFSETSTTTKLRVVFDASAKTSSGKSLNDIQWVGPTVQSDLFSILLKFRVHSYVMTADIEKIYRQITIHPSQRSLQKIIWREAPSHQLRAYHLNTVTYGTASAAYLATRTLNRLAEDERPNFPEAAVVTQDDFYVDDLLTGAKSEAKLIKLKGDLINMLARGGFNLRKWNSNSKRVLDNEKREPTPHAEQQELAKNDAAPIKTLGLWWDSGTDTFHYKHGSKN